MERERPASTDRSLLLSRECRVLSRYLIGREPTRDVLERYERAVGTLFHSGEDDAHLVQAAVDRPWLLPYLDAACGIVRREDLLRRKLLLLTAILEATTEYTRHFLPRRVSRPGFAFRLAFHGTRAALQAAVGLALLPLMGRPDR